MTDDMASELKLRFFVVLGIIMGTLNAGVIVVFSLFFGGA